VEVAEYRRHLGRMKTGMGNALRWWWWWLEQRIEEIDTLQPTKVVIKGK